MDKHVILCLIVLISATDISAELVCQSLHCKDDECFKNNTCVKGCESGFISDQDGQCVHQCPENCATCAESNCSSCHPGYYGSNCNLTCGGCENQTCQMSTGQCEKGCANNYDGEPYCKKMKTNKPSKKRGTKPVDKEAFERNIYIWTAGCIISATILAIVVIIIYINLQRKRGWKPYIVGKEQTLFDQTDNIEDKVETQEL